MIIIRKSAISPFLIYISIDSQKRKGRPIAEIGKMRKEYARRVNGHGERDLLAKSDDGGVLADAN